MYVRTRRILSFLLVLFLAAGAIPAQAFADGEAGMTGTGTADDPYVIMTLEQLDAVRNDLIAHYRLGADIDASDTKDWYDGQGWKPIGDASSPFIGEFDGAGHVIRGLTIERPDETYVGMFGIVGSYAGDGTVRNVGLENASVVGNGSTGGLVGRIQDGTVDGCYVNGTVTGTGTYTYAGGLVGWNDGTIVASHASGSVTGKSSVGGLAGMNNGGDIIRSYAESAVTAYDYTAGGLLGENRSGAVSLTYATGTVQADSGAGGLVGFTDYGGVEKSYATGAVIGRIYTAGLIASNNGGGLWDSFWDSESTGQTNACNNNSDYGISCEATELSTAQALAQSSYVGLDFNSDWFMIDGSTRPFLRSEWSASIRNAHQLQLMAMNLAADYALAGDIDFGRTFTDASRSDMWATSADDGSGFAPIGKSYSAGMYNGVFDGNGHVIRDLTIARPGEDPVGLFGMIGASGSGASDTSGIVRNVGLEGGRVTGGNNTGALVGYNNAGTVESAYSTAKVAGARYVGGLVGTNGNASTVSRSYAAGDVNGVQDVGGLVGYQLRLAIGGITSHSFAAGHVAGENGVGGLIGTNDTGIIEQSYATGSVTGESNVGGLVGSTNDFSKISQSYAAGRVVGTGDPVGGLAGAASVGSMDATDYYDKDATGQSDTGKGTPLSTSEMKRAQTYGSMLDSGAWALDEGKTYPVLIGVTPDALRDAAPPTVASAKVENGNPNRIDVSFDEEVGGTDASGFALAADGEPAVVTGIEGAGAKTLVLVADRALERGQDVRLSYDGQAGSIADTANHPLLGFADFAVSPADDLAPPTITIAMTKADGSAYTEGEWTNQSVTVSAAASDETSVASVVYSVDDAATWNAYTAPVVFQEDGIHPIAFKATDEAGNQTVEQRTVKISTSGLKLTPTLVKADGSGYTSGAWTNTSVTVSVYAEAGDSELASLTVAYDGGPAQAYASDSPIEIADEGAHRLLFQAADRAGNAISAELSVNIDKTPPAIVLNGANPLRVPLGGSYAEPGATATDAVDGELPAGSIVISGSVDTGKAGHYTVLYTAADRAGNTASVARDVDVEGSPGNPVPSIPPVVTVPPAAIVEMNDAGVDAAVTKEARSDGRSAVRVEVKAGDLSAALASRPTTVIVVRADADLVEVALPAKALLEAANNPNAVVQVQAGNASYSLPLGVVQRISPQATVSVIIGQASPAAAAAANKAAQSEGVQPLLGRPVEFSLEVDGKEVTDWGGAYIARTIALPAGTSAEDATAAWIDESGSLRFVPSLFATSGGVTTATIYAPHDSLYTVIRSKRTFADLKGHWAQADVEEMAGRRIVEGITDASFAPDAPVTRAEFAAMLARSLGLADTAEQSLFADVPADGWYAGAVAAASKAGLIDGYGDGTFRPKERITREQMAAMIARALRFAGKAPQADAAAGDALARFADGASVPGWAREAANELLAAGLMQGKSDTTFAPETDATRAESAVLLKRMLTYAGFID